MTSTTDTPAQRFRARRLALGLTQEQLGTALARTREQVCAYETGRAAIPRWVWHVLDGIERDDTPGSHGWRRRPLSVV